MQLQPRKWNDHVPSHDDFGQLIKNVFIDGKTKNGPWAVMTPASHRLHGAGIGPGKGQRYELQDNGDWLKTAG